MPDLAAPVLRWYADAARDLPWRRADASPWAVLVSEVMLQQTPVARVLPAYDAWMARWPTPAALAVEPAGAAVRQWGRLGYPRRALHLHAAARVLVERYAGRIPESLEELRALPGVGSYTAAAVASFAYRHRHPVIDTNVRRVLARALAGQPRARTATAALDRQRAESVLPADPEQAARFGVALMELGALVCTARSPHCGSCPIATACRWHADGHPAAATSSSSRSSYAGTDREVRGRLLAVLRGSAGPVPLAALAASWPDAEQRDRAVAGLLADGLVQRHQNDRLALPG